MGEALRRSGAGSMYVGGVWQGGGRKKGRTAAAVAAAAKETGAFALVRRTVHTWKAVDVAPRAAQYRMLKRMLRQQLVGRQAKEGGWTIVDRNLALPLSNGPNVLGIAAKPPVRSSSPQPPPRPAV
nr:hypothetical protein CFP56_20210 [Quercus suber]